MGFKIKNPFKKNPFKALGNGDWISFLGATNPNTALLSQFYSQPIGKAYSDEYANNLRRRDELAVSVNDNQTIDGESKKEFLDLLLDKNYDYTSKGVYEKVSGEFQKAIEGIEPKFKARKATEEYYKAIIDKPGGKQTRSPDLLMSNAFTGVGGRGKS